MKKPLNTQKSLALVPVRKSSALTPDLSRIGHFRFSTSLDDSGRLPVNQESLESLSYDIGRLQSIAASVQHEQRLGNILARLDELHEVKEFLEDELGSKTSSAALVPHSAHTKASANHKPSITATMNVQNNTSTTNLNLLKPTTTLSSVTTTNNNQTYTTVNTSTNNNCVYNYNTTYVTQQVVPKESDDKMGTELVLKKILKTQREMQKELGKTRTELAKTQAKLVKAEGKIQKAQSPMKTKPAVTTQPAQPSNYTYHNTYNIQNNNYVYQPAISTYVSPSFTQLTLTTQALPLALPQAQVLNQRQVKPALTGSPDLWPLPRS